MSVFGSTVSATMRHARDQDDENDRDADQDFRHDPHAGGFYAAGRGRRFAPCPGRLVVRRAGSSASSPRLPGFALG